MATTDNDKGRGLYGKYLVFRTRELNTGGHDRARMLIEAARAHASADPVAPCFVLNYMRDPHARAALEAYADSCQREYPQLAADLRREVERAIQATDYESSGAAESAWPEIADLPDDLVARLAWRAGDRSGAQPAVSDATLTAWNWTTDSPTGFAVIARAPASENGPSGSRWIYEAFAEEHARRQTRAVHPQRYNQRVIRGLVDDATRATIPGAPLPYVYDPGASTALLPLAGCHANREGECSWAACPQKRDGEPERSSRWCPLDEIDEDDAR